jgi:hypothetical protein
MLKIGRVDYFNAPREKVVAVSRSIGLFQEAAFFCGYYLDSFPFLSIADAGM